MSTRVSKGEEPTVDFHQGRDKSAHYTTPEGYMQGLSRDILSQIERVESHQIMSPERVSLWLKLKPSLYLAASFVGLFLGFKVFFAWQGEIREEALEESYLSYYEDYAAQLLDRDLDYDYEDEISL